MKNILFTSNKVHTTARIGVLFFSLCFSPLINAGNAEKPMNGIESSETTQQNKIKITGVVTDSKGESIIGANVVVKGQSNVGAITDVEGRYQIMIPSDNAILQVSYLGYVTEEIKVKRAPQHQCDAERRLQSAGRSCSSRLRTAEKGKRSRFYEFHQTKGYRCPFAKPE